MTALAADGLIEDTGVWPTMTAIASCLCTELSLAGLPETCFCGVLPGDEAPWDYVSDEAGMAYVRMVSAYLSQIFPDQQTVPGCAADLAYELEIGVLFCAPVMEDSRGNPPSVATMLDTTRIQMAAMSAAYRAFSCCPSLNSRDVMVGTYTPVGPQGGAVGGTWQIWVAEGAVKSRGN